MLKVRRLRLFLTFASIFSALSCHRPARSGALIDAYREADCVVPTMARGIEPQTRGWDARITIAGKATARIQGFDAVGGQIDVHYGRDGESVTAVNYRDFIYPSDVRLNDRHDRLYVKARGFGRHVEGNMAPRVRLAESQGSATSAHRSGRASRGMPNAAEMTLVRIQVGTNDSLTSSTLFGDRRDPAGRSADWRSDYNGCIH
jgi:hypothetical protein